jgi:hypothetical protein
MVKPLVISFLVLALIVISSDRKAQEEGGVLIGGVEASEKKIELPSFYSSSSSDARELLMSGLELDKFMDPSGYERTVEGWKIKEKIAGRDAVKHNTSPISARFGLAKGFQFIDAELGIGLAGYLEECANSPTHKETKFEQPKLVFQALLVDTAVSGDVFESF